jgi:hypothetical protein
MTWNVQVDDGMGIIGMAEPGALVRLGGVFTVECYDRRGRLKWRDVFHNKVPNVGLDHILATEFTSGAQITAWYIGLTTASPTPAAGDTMASHAGWTEYTSYSQTNRQAYTGVESAQAVTNSASPATFTVNAGSTTCGGAFIVSNNTISGSTGTLAAVGAVSGGNRTPASGDQIVCSYNYSAASVN